MRTTFPINAVFPVIILGAVSLFVSASDSPTSPQTSVNSATVLEIKGGNDVWVSHGGGGKRRLAVGDRIAMPCEIETGRNSRVLFDFPDELVAVGENSKGTLEFPGEVKNLIGTGASETKKGAEHQPTIRDQAGRAEGRANRTMIILYSPPKGKGNAKVLLVHGDASFSAKRGKIERKLEPGQMVVVPEDGKGEPYCVHVDLAIAAKTSRLLQDFKEHWNAEEIEKAIDSQRGRFIQRLPYGLRRGDGPDERRLLRRHD